MRRDKIYVWETETQREVLTHNTLCQEQRKWLAFPLAIKDTGTAPAVLFSQPPPLSSTAFALSFRHRQRFRGTRKYQPQNLNHLQIIYGRHNNLKLPGDRPPESFLITTIFSYLQKPNFLSKDLSPIGCRVNVVHNRLRGYPNIHCVFPHTSIIIWWNGLMQGIVQYIAIFIDIRPYDSITLTR